MKKIAVRGFTLGEMLVTVAILGILASVVMPMLSSGDPQKLDVAIEETANTLRFALSEATRTGGYVLVDGKTNAGRLALYYSNVSGVQGAAVKDPLTKRAMDIDVKSHPFSQGVTLTPQFMAGGGARPQLLISPTDLVVMDAPSNYGPLQAGSGVLLGLGAQSVMVNLDQVTRRVTLP